MRKIILILIMAVMAWPAAALAFDHSYKLWNSDLKQFNQHGYVHYGAWKRNQQRLNQYVQAMQSVTHRQLAGWSAAQRQAFWINAHNALVVFRMLDAYPKVYDLHDLRWMIAGQSVTVEDIRDKILRGTESRVLLLSDALGIKTSLQAGKPLHILFAMCEGTRSSPLLASRAYTAKALATQLEQQVQRTLSDPAYVQVDGKLRIFHVGHFFHQYQRDFKQYKGDSLLFERSSGVDQGLLQFIFPYLDQSMQDTILAKQNRPWRVDYRPAQRAVNGGE